MTFYKNKNKTVNRIKDISEKQMFPDTGIITLDGITVGNFILTRSKVILGTITLG